jgi:hypothetical protein
MDNFAEKLNHLAEYLDTLNASRNLVRRGIPGGDDLREIAQHLSAQERVNCLSGRTVSRCQLCVTTSRPRTFTKSLTATTATRS